MSAQPFNSQGGYTSGIPPIPVIDINGNVTTNVVTTGNVIANVIFSNDLNVSKKVTFSDVSNVKILGGSSGQILTTDGFGNLSWSAGNITSITGDGGTASSSIRFLVSLDGGYAVESAGQFLSTNGFPITGDGGTASSSIKFLTSLDGGYV